MRGILRTGRKLRRKAIDRDLVDLVLVFWNKLERQ
jgi:hypothetical protein